MESFLTPGAEEAWLRRNVPSADQDEARALARVWRYGASPGTAEALYRMNMAMDVRKVLPLVSAPTLVLHQRADPSVRAEHGPYLAEHIPGAAYVELDGAEHVPTAATAPRLLDHLATEVDTAGDGFFARFDGPARGIRCAVAIREAVREIGLQVRIGLHAGECEVLDGKVAGIAVAIGARLSARAAAGEVLVSQTVKDLVAGSDIAFEDRGLAELKGVPGKWRLYSVASS